MRRNSYRWLPALLISLGAALGICASFVLGGLLLDLTGEKIGLARLLVLESRKIRSAIEKPGLGESAAIAMLPTAALNQEGLRHDDWELPNVTCTQHRLQQCLETYAKQDVLVSLAPGEFLVGPISLPSNIALYVPSDTVVTFRPNLNYREYCKTCVNGDLAVVKMQDEGGRAAKDVRLYLDGTITGRTATGRTAEPVRYEGLSIPFVSRFLVSGTGSIESIEGDCIDVDGSRDGLISNLQLRNCWGSGIHFGSSRPLGDSSFGNLVIGTRSVNNGWKFGRAGYDNSWPNEGSVTYVGNCAEGNYRNWDIRGGKIGLYGNSSAPPFEVQDVLSGALPGSNSPVSRQSCVRTGGSQ